MTRDERERLRDIKEAIAAIRAHLARGSERPGAGDNALLHDALLFQFVVIGEAVKRLAPEHARPRPRSPGRMSPASAT